MRYGALLPENIVKVGAAEPIASASISDVTCDFEVG
jgi:hypothetical protein